MRIAVEDDFIIAPKYNNSLNALIKNYPNGVPPRVICRVLGITILEYEKIVESGIMKLRLLLVPEGTGN